MFIKREETEKVIYCLLEGRDGEGISCLYRGKRRRRLFLVYKEGRDGEGHFLFIKREEMEKVISCL